MFSLALIGPGLRPPLRPGKGQAVCEGCACLLRQDLCGRLESAGLFAEGGRAGTHVGHRHYRLRT